MGRGSGAQVTGRQSKANKKFLNQAAKAEKLGIAGAKPRIPAKKVGKVQLGKKPKVMKAKK